MVHHSGVCSPWDPSEVLEINSNGRCIGRARNNRQNCLGILSAKDMYEAEHVKKNISITEPNPIVLDGKMRELAKLLLCKRCRQDQAPTVVERWQVLVTHFAAGSASLPATSSPGLCDASFSRASKSSFNLIILVCILQGIFFIVLILLFRGVLEDPVRDVIIN